MSNVKTVLLILGITVLVIIIASVIIARHIKKKNTPGYKPVFTKTENILSLVSVVLGVVLILGGIFVPKFLSERDNNTELQGEADYSDLALTQPEILMEAKG